MLSALKFCPRQHIGIQFRNKMRRNKQKQKTNSIANINVIYVPYDEGPFQEEKFQSLVSDQHLIQNHSNVSNQSKEESKEDNQGTHDAYQNIWFEESHNFMMSVSHSYANIQVPQTKNLLSLPIITNQLDDGNQTSNFIEQLQNNQMENILPEPIENTYFINERNQYQRRKKNKSSFQRCLQKKNKLNKGNNFPQVYQIGKIQKKRNKLLIGIQNRNAQRVRLKRGKSKKIKKNLGISFETKNFLPLFRLAHLNFLEKKLGKQKVEEKQIFKNLKNSKNKKINKKQYVELYQISDFEIAFKQFFKNKILYRVLMQSSCNILQKQKYHPCLPVFENAFTTKKFGKIHDGHKIKRKDPISTSNKQQLQRLIVQQNQMIKLKSENFLIITQNDL